MAQFLRPDSDVSAGAWTTVPLWSKLDEAVASDVDFATSNNNTSPDTFEVSLSDPGGTPGAGTVTLRVRRSKSATGGHALQERFALYQGTTLIEELAQATPDSTTWATVSLVITNRAAITDWTDLRVRVSREGATGGSGGTRRSLRCSFIELEAPDAAAPEEHSGTVTATGGGTATTSGRKDGQRAQALTGGGAITTAQRKDGQLAAAITGGGIATLGTAGAHDGTVTATGGGVAALAPRGEHAGPAVATGAGVVSLATLADRAVGFVITGGGAVVAAASTERAGPVTSTGGGLVTIVYDVDTGGGGGPEEADGSFDVTGGGAVTLAITAERRATLLVTGAGAITLDELAERHGLVMATGGGSIDVAGDRATAIALVLTGAGVAEVLGESVRASLVLITGGGSVTFGAGEPIVLYPLVVIVARRPCAVLIAVRRARPTLEVRRHQ